MRRLPGSVPLPAPYPGSTGLAALDEPAQDGEVKRDHPLLIQGLFLPSLANSLPGSPEDFITHDFGGFTRKGGPDRSIANPKDT
jgi:hypothetical protein